MDILRELHQELQYEYETTKKFIERFPEDKSAYKPHEKSTALMPLATHIVEIFAWPAIMVDTEKLDFAGNAYRPARPASRDDLLALLMDHFERGSKAVERADAAILDDPWSINQGDTVLMKWSKYGAIRHALNQITHHRAQLGVYYRLLNIPVPASYGPSADDAPF